MPKGYWYWMGHALFEGFVAVVSGVSAVSGGGLICGVVCVVFACLTVNSYRNANHILFLDALTQEILARGR